MYRIAILGCENSHADIFLKYIYGDKKTQDGNYVTVSERAVDDVEVVGVYSDEKEAMQKLHDAFGVPMMESSDELVGKVDGIVVTARHGDNHFKYAKPYISSAVAEDGKIVIEGVIDTYILYISSKEDSPVYNFKAEVPFSITLDTPGTSTGDKVRSKLTANHISYNLNAAGEIELRMVLGVSAAAFGKNSVNVISDITEEEFDRGNSPSIVLYFIQKGDTLWDIAKRYHTKEEYIRELNNIDGEILTEGMQILIPKA